MIRDNKENSTAIVLAAGQGRRMKSAVQKQYISLNDKPVLYYTLKTFEKSAVNDIILVVGKEEIEYCQKEIVDKWNFTKVKAIVAGGAERYLSVYYGLQAIHNKQKGIILIHDGARPLISNEVILRCIEGAKEYDACVAAMPVKDTIKVADNQNWVAQTPDRNTLWMVQTPQAFKIKIIQEAYELMYKDIQTGKTLNITDDAMVVEHYLDKKVKLVYGDYKNIKITTSEDLILAQALLNNL